MPKARLEGAFREGERRGDLLHANFIEIVDERLAAQIPEVEVGHVLVSVRELSAVLVIDLETQRVVWSLTGDFVNQHHTTVLPNGNIMLFDNRGGDVSSGGGASLIREVEPTSGKTRWLYQRTPEEPFESTFNGSCYRLPNGNTLITESLGGRAFEITTDGEIVWEYYNPNRSGDEGQFIARLYDVVRLRPDYSPTGPAGLDWLD